MNIQILVVHGHYERLHIIKLYSASVSTFALSGPVGESMPGGWLVWRNRRRGRRINRFLFKCSLLKALVTHGKVSIGYRHSKVPLIANPSAF